MPVEAIDRRRAVTMLNRSRTHGQAHLCLWRLAVRAVDGGGMAPAVSCGAKKFWSSRSRRASSDRSLMHASSVHASLCTGSCAAPHVWLAKTDAGSHRGAALALQHVCACFPASLIV